MKSLKRKKLIYLRVIELNKTQEEFGEPLGVKGQYISLLENGKANGSFNFWNKFKEIYNIPSEEMEAYRELS